MNYTDNYEFKIAESTDRVNLLTDIYPTIEDIDSILKGISDRAIGTATHSRSGSNNELTRTSGLEDCAVFKATLSEAPETGDTFSVDSVPCTFCHYINGQPVKTGELASGAPVLFILVGQFLYVIGGGGSASGDINASTLNGHPDTYFATAERATDIEEDITSINGDIAIINGKLPYKIAVVTALPANPDNNTLYFIKEA